MSVMDGPNVTKLRKMVLEECDKEVQVASGGSRRSSMTIEEAVPGNILKLFMGLFIVSHFNILLVWDVLDSLYRNEECNEIDENKKVSDEEVSQETKRKFPRAVESVLKILQSQSVFSFKEKLEEAEEKGESNEEPTTNVEEVFETEDNTEETKLEPQEQVKLSDEELKQKMKASLGLLIEQQAIGQMEFQDL